MNANLLWRLWPGSYRFAPSCAVRMPLAGRIGRAWRVRRTAHAAQALRQRADAFARAGNSSYAADIRAACEAAAAPSPQAGQ
jgi:hypothetical protein